MTQTVAVPVSRRASSTEPEYGFQPMLLKCNSVVDLSMVKGRATIVLLVACPGRILMVQSMKGGAWGLPQGEIEEGETYIDAALRVGAQIGLKPSLFPKGDGKGKKPMVIGECVNPIPPERKTGVECKHLFFELLPACTDEWVRLDGKYRTYEWVQAEQQLRAILTRRLIDRPIKSRAIIDAVDLLVTGKNFAWAS